jgi:hypothetical protein
MEPDVNVADEEFFAKLEDVMARRKLNDSAVSQILGVPRTTVTRWRQRTVIPHPLMRPLIFEHLEKDARP